MQELLQAMGDGVKCGFRLVCLNWVAQIQSRGMGLLVSGLDKTKGLPVEKGWALGDKDLRAHSMVQIELSFVEKSLAKEIG